MKIVIKSLGKWDSRINRLYNKLYPEKQGRFLQKLEAKNLILCACFGKKLIGFCRGVLLAFGRERIGYIEELFVEKAFRNKGVGSKLIERLIKRFRQFQAKVVFVSVSEKENLKFYQKLGFRTCKGFWLYKIPKDC